MAVVMCRYLQGHLAAIGDMDKAKFLMTAPGVYDGTYVNHSAVHTYGIKAVAAHSQWLLLLHVERHVSGEAP